MNKTKGPFGLLAGVFALAALGYLADHVEIEQTYQGPVLARGVSSCGTISPGFSLPRNTCAQPTQEFNYYVLIREGDDGLRRVNIDPVLSAEQLAGKDEIDINLDETYRIKYQHSLLDWVNPSFGERDWDYFKAMEVVPVVKP